MKIAVIGASAGIGLLAVQQALAKGHEVIALARDLSPVPDHPFLTKIEGSATNVADLKKAIHTANAVLITIGTKSKRQPPYFRIRPVP